jgi:uncharacterized protein with PQ loop repeat
MLEMQMQTLGLTASVLTIILVFIGLVSQVIKNYKRKSCGGLSLIYFIIIFFAYTSWSLYGFSKSDWFLIIPQTAGALISVILLFQFYIYKDKGK